MAEQIVSPGVFTRETDLSFLPQGIAQIGAAVAGPTEQGPAFVPKLITSQADYESIFGKPKDFYTGFAIQNYLKEAGSVTVIRIAGLDGYTLGEGIVVTATSESVDQIVAVLAPSASIGTTTGSIFTGQDLANGAFAISASGTSFGVASVYESDPNTADDVFGTNPFYGKAAYTYNYFDPADTLLLAGPLTLTFAALPFQDFESAATNASTPFITSQAFGNEKYDLFKIHTLGDGEKENKRFKIQISSIKAGANGAYGSFTLLVRDYNDTDRKKNVIESFNNLNLDPASTNFIAKRIGDIFTQVQDSGKIVETGQFDTRSKYIRIELAEQSSPQESVPFGFRAYTLPLNLGAANTSYPVVKYTTASSGSTTFSSGFDFAVKGNHNYLNAIPFEATVGENVEFGLDTTAGLVPDASDIIGRNFVVALQGGYNGQDITIKPLTGEYITSTNTQGFDCSTLSSAGTRAYLRGIEAVGNADAFDINLIITPGIIRELHTPVADKVIEVCETRGDVFYLVDLSKIDSGVSEVVSQASSLDTSYAAAYYPWLKTVDAATGKVLSVPPSVLMLATYAQSDRLGAEWFAPAGLNRGGIGGAVGVLDRLTQSERDILYEGKVNPIATFPGQGVSAFGQKTLQTAASSLDRVNVRRLLINLKKFVASTSRFLLFEQNNGATRTRFLNTVNPYLESVQQRQGLYAFRVVMDESNNTADVIDRNLLVGSIFLQPSKTAEFIVIDFNILPTGAQFTA